jgi:5'(3')-deoxyribonucleotidase
MRKYLEKKLEPSLLNCGEKIPMHPIALCIPVSYEYPHFFRTLRSIHLSAMKALSYLGENYQVFIIVCCINARENDALEVKENNVKLLYELRCL